MGLVWLPSQAKGIDSLSPVVMAAVQETDEIAVVASGADEIAAVPASQSEQYQKSSPGRVVALDAAFAWPVDPHCALSL